MRLILVAFSLLVLTSSSFAQVNKPAIADAKAHFTKAERDLANLPRDQYDAARDKLCVAALEVVVSDPSSKAAEELLHWVLSYPCDSPSGKNAVQCLVEYHASSKASVQRLLSYSKRPSSWSRELFAGFAISNSSSELGWIVETCAAIHEKSLLEMADEIKVPGTDLKSFQSRLGAPLTQELAACDIAKFESRVIDMFTDLAKRHGSKNIGGQTVQELAEGSTFSVRHLRLGKQVPTFSGESTDGEKISLDYYRGRVILVDFWATWCAPCAASVPRLRALKRELDDTKFAIIGISVDKDATMILKFMKDQMIDWPNIVDRNETLFKKWQTLELPWYYVLDQEQIVRYRGNDEQKAASVAMSILGTARK